MIRERLKKALENPERWWELQNIVAEAFKQGKFEPVMNYYDRISRKKPKLAAPLRAAISWSAYRSVKGKRFVLVFAQPFALLFTQHTHDFLPRLSPAKSSLALKRLYGLEDVQLQTPGILISPSSIPVRDPRVVDTLFLQPPLLPIKVKEKGWHFRFLPVVIEGELPIREPVLQEDRFVEIKDLLRHEVKAEDVIIVHPVEIFDLWLAYDSLNHVARSLDNALNEEGSHVSD